jgi:Ca2+-binding EF-hand superfamily protein
MYGAMYKLKHKSGHVKHAKDRVDRVLAEYDTDKNGSLSKAEFVLALQRDEDIFSFFE